MADPKNPHKRQNIIIVTLSILLVLTLAYIISQETQLSNSEAVTPDTLPNSNQVVIQPGEHNTTLADLGTKPDWSALELWQESITREDFEFLLTEIYTKGDAWKNYITINSDHAIIRSDTELPNAYFRLNFTPLFSEVSPHRSWSTAGELPPTTKDKPLAGLHIAIDAGHIGGDFAKIEERWFKIGDNLPVKEGEMTLLTGKIMKDQLVELGAKVYLVRGENKPINPRRPEDYLEAAKAKAKSRGIESPEAIEALQNKYFYRTGEIRERARRVNLAFNPDLVLCLHYNAEAWDDPANPTLTENNHYHVLLHGALTSGEIAHDDERYEMLVKILQRSHEEEKALGKYITHALGLSTKLPAFDYDAESNRAVQIDGISGLWARNLLANRLYQSPVIFLEPYLMNNQEVHDRVQLGNYSGTKLINGEEKKSIYNEYADAVVLALREYYLDNRIIYDEQ